MTADRVFLYFHGLPGSPDELLLCKKPPRGVQILAIDRLQYNHTPESLKQLSTDISKRFPKVQFGLYLKEC